MSTDAGHGFSRAVHEGHVDDSGGRRYVTVLLVGASSDGAHMDKITVLHNWHHLCYGPNSLQKAR